MNELLKSKFSSRDRHQLIQDKIKEPVDVLIYTEAPIAPQEKANLQTAGFNTHYMMGNVFSGSIPNIKQLEEIARLPFVVKIELSKSMIEELL